MKSPRNLTGGTLPVFVFPESLTFIADDQSTFKQILTVYNPYTFSVQFKVFGTAPRCYKVTEAEGIIKPRCYVDVFQFLAINYKNVVFPQLFGCAGKGSSGYSVIRCVETACVTERSDKFRFCLFEHGVRKHIGEKEITALVLPTKTSATERHSEGRRGRSFKPPSLEAFTEDVKSGPGALVICLGLFCLITLMLPTDGDRNTSLPRYLHLTLNQKLIAAYILGLVTMVVLKT